MRHHPLSLIALSLCIGLVSCRGTTDRYITLIDIGTQDRMGIGNELRMINRYNPKAIVLNFLLVEDSLEIDSIVAREIEKAKSIMVSSVELKREHPSLQFWQEVVSSHDKFRTDYNGFTNFSIEDDSTIIPMLPMRQASKLGSIPSISFATASATFGPKTKYYERGNQEFQLEQKFFDRSFKIISDDDLLSGNFDPDDINGKILVLGHVLPKEYYYLAKGKEKAITGTFFQACLIREVIDVPE